MHGTTIRTSTDTSQKNKHKMPGQSLQQLVEPQDSVQQIHCIHTDCGTRTARVVKKLSENC